MFKVGESVCWSASDLTAASECEYAVLRKLDRLLGRGTALEVTPDPLLAQIARLGDEHENRELTRLLDLHGEHDADSGHGVAQIERTSTRSTSSLETLQAMTVATLTQGADVVYQAGFFDGEFHGYADFLEHTTNGWAVCDAKLARQQRPKALLQVAAYVDQLERAGFAVPPVGRLLLGNGHLQEFPLQDVLPVFRERRERLRRILREHRAETEPVGWDDERYVVCGRCAECTAAAEEAVDVLIVAGLRMDQRKKLRAAGITTIRQLAVATSGPSDISSASFDKLRAQAGLQVTQMDAGGDADGRPVVSHEVIATTYLAALPAPSPGDIFFDFEGDPMYNEGDLEQWGLEYLFGVMEAPVGGARTGHFLPFWAHSRAEERAAFVAFMAYVAQRRVEHPDMHIYHYAPYETTALKRLAAVHATHEKELDDLLRSGVFIDLYAVVRGSIRVSQPSYSIKKLEPLYMSVDEVREGDVQAGDASVVEYHEFRALRDAGHDWEAEAKLAGLADYNEYDCLSTLRLRGWLLDRAAEHGIAPRGAEVLEIEGETDEEQDDLFLDLRGQSGPGARLERTPEQQASAMLAFALGFHRREDLPYWWAHFDRLRTPVDEWGSTRDVFVVEESVVDEDWAILPPKRVARRTLRLRGRFGPGSTVKAGDHCRLLYDAPVPSDLSVPIDAVRGCTAGRQEILDIDVDDIGREVLVVLEAVTTGCPTYDALPVAVVPGDPISTRSIVDAIREVASTAVGRAPLPAQPAIDILCRRTPRLSTLAALPQTGVMADDIVAALLDLDHSYVPVQGPPGTGKTYTGSEVIARLVRDHNWRVGVVGQSHAVVENMLDAIVDAGLDPALIGKSKPANPAPKWTALSDKGRATFLADGAESGCVLGGTAWTFVSQNSVPPGTLDLLVVDEAGQFSLATTIGASVAAPRLLLLGDPQQLPQVSQGTHGEPVDGSALGWVMGNHETIPAELGYFLGTSYRMHPALCERVSRLSYAGDLYAHRCTSERLLAGVAPGLEVVPLAHRGNSVESEAEADEVVRQVQRLLGKPWLDPEKGETPRPVVESDFRVVAPYNAQVQLIRRRLVEAGFGDVRVGTVDKFQGQQAPVVIVSMTASSQENVPRGIGFLLNRNRVNVAVSRAQWLAVLIRAEALTSFMPSSAAGLLELGAFIGLCEARSPAAEGK